MAHDHERTKKKPPATDRICKSCHRILATTSPEGDLTPASTQDKACDACKPFEDLYGALQTTDAAFRELYDRRKTYGPRAEAVLKCEKAHMEFDNFMIKVEAQVDQNNNTDNNKESTDPASTTEPPQQGQKRPLTPSSADEPMAKRLRPNHKRTVSFGDGVVFRDIEESRGSSEYHRGSQNYVPGRNAAPQGKELLDTAGYATTDAKFFGVMKRGRGWTPTPFGKQLDAEWQLHAEDETNGAPENGDDNMKEGNTEVRGKSLTADDAVAKENEFPTETQPAVDGVSNEHSQQPKQLRRDQSPPAHSTSAGDLTLTIRSPKSEHPPSSPPKDTTNTNKRPSIPTPTLTPTMPIQATLPVTPTNTAFPPPTTKNTHYSNSSPGSPPSHPGSAQEDAQEAQAAKAYTYGLGWSVKYSPRSRPRGEMWKSGFPDALSQSEVKEMIRRGRRTLRYD